MADVDGTLCRITSTREEYENSNIFIVKTPDDERKECKFPFKLIILGGEESQTESLSEKSDDELSEEDLRNFVFTPKGVVKEKNCDTTLEQTSDINKQEKDEPLKEQNKNEIFRPKYDKNRQSSNRRTFKHPIRGGYKKNFANYNSNRRNFHSLEGPVTYDNSVQNFPKNDIEPWLQPPLVNYNPDFYRQTYPCFGNSVESVGQSPVNSFPENSLKCKGLLGDAPYSTPPFPPDFPRMNQNDSYISDPSYCERNWTNEYPDYHCEGYQRSHQNNRPVSGPPRQNYHHPSKRHWTHKYRNKPNWNNNQNYKSRGRNSPDTYKQRASSDNYKQRASSDNYKQRTSSDNYKQRTFTDTYKQRNDFPE